MIQRGSNDATELPSCWRSTAWACSTLKSTLFVSPGRLTWRKQNVCVKMVIDLRLLLGEGWGLVSTSFRSRTPNWNRPVQSLNAGETLSYVEMCTAQRGPIRNPPSPTPPHPPPPFSISVNTYSLLLLNTRCSLWVLRQEVFS